MNLPWMRLDTDIYAHDKILTLIHRPHGREAFAVYVFGIAWSAGQGTDGRIPTLALPVIHGMARHATALVAAGLWETDPDGDGWVIHNFAGRQRIVEIEKMVELGKRGAKARWGDHGATP